MVTTQNHRFVTVNPSSSPVIADRDYDQAEGGYDPDETRIKKRTQKEHIPQDSDAKQASKRRKTSASQSKSKSTQATSPHGTAAQGGRRRKTLSLLPNMPLDVIFEIFSHLAPKDLINLSRTSVAFQETMLDPKTSTIWKAVRKEFDSDAPDPAQGFTEARWGMLLFGNTCEWCGKKNVQEVDWNNLKRTCWNCKNNHLLGAEDQQFSKAFADYPTELFNYLPHTNIRPKVPGGYDRNHHLRKLYWEPDVHEMAKEWKIFNAAAEISPEDREAFDTWKKEREAVVQANVSMTSVYRQWSRNRISKMRGNHYDNSKERLEAAKLRLLKKGYSQVDIDNSIHRYTPGIRTGWATISNSVWAKIRPKLEPLVEKEMNRRLVREMEPVIAQRMAVLRNVYNRHLTQLSPSERYLCPPVEFLRPLDSVVEILEADRDVTITEQSFDPIISNFSQYIAKYQLDRRNAILESIPEHLLPERPEDVFSLARFIFRCEKGRPICGRAPGPAAHQTLIGWPIIASDPCVKERGLQLRPDVMVDRPCKLDYYDRASDISCKLITLAGLDPNTTTIVEMDARDPRFVLLKRWFDDSWTDTYQVFTWRVALYYVSGKYRDQNSSLPKFRLATSEETEMARQHTAAVCEVAKAWSCNHCHEFFESSQAEAKSVIFQHLQSQHGVFDPSPSGDFVLNAQCWPKLEAPCKIPLRVSSTQCFLCQMCGALSSQHFDMDGIRKHLRIQHYVFDPQPGSGFWKDFILDKEMVVGLE